jgi:autotransporter-associated beta strand protein
MSWVLSGGFAAKGGDLHVSLNSGATLVWDSTPGFVIAAQELQLGSNTADSTVYFDNAINLGTNAGRTIRVFDGTAAVDAVITNAIGITSGTGGLIKQGPGTLILAAANTYNSITTVSAGTLRIADGTNATGTTGGGTINVATGATVIFDRNGADSTQGTVVGGGNFVQNQNNTIVITTAFTNTGNVTVNTGTLQIGNGGAGSFSSATVALTSASANLVFNTNAVLSVAANVSGSGSVFYNPAAAVSYTLLGAQTQTGMTYIGGIAGSSIQIGNGVNTGSGSISGNMTLSGANAVLVFNRPDDISYAGNITGSGTQVRKLTNSTMTFSGNSTFTAPVSVDAGTVVVTGTFGAGGGTLGSGAVLRGIGGTAGGTWVVGNSTIEVGGVTTNTVSNLTLG